MAAGNFQPPPTWAPVILESSDPATGQKKGTFNPEWLKWFVELTSGATANSGGQAVIGTGNFVGPAVGVNGNLVVFDGITGKLGKDGGPVPVVPLFADTEGLAGMVDGVNDTFTSLHDPDPVASAIVFHQGNPLLFTIDFTISGGNTWTFSVPPALGDPPIAFYRYSA